MAHSFTFGELPAAPSPAVIQELRGYEIAWISDAVNLYLMDREIRPIFPGIPRVVGPAVTVTVPPGDFLMVSAALTKVRPGDILVIDSRGCTSRAVWGEYFSTWARGLDVAAVVIDGASRDATDVEALQFPVFARATIPRMPTLNGPGEVNVPVSCGGVCVLPGDIVVADREGVIVVPLRHLEETLKRVRVVAEREKSHNGVTVGGRKEFDDFYQRSFAKRVGAVTPSNATESES
jgi:4-hydroxy-4-methyl-2-oxoglutarate aldolase